MVESRRHDYRIRQLQHQSALGVLAEAVGRWHCVLLDEPDTGVLDWVLRGTGGVVTSERMRIRPEPGAGTSAILMRGAGLAEEYARRMSLGREESWMRLSERIVYDVVDNQENSLENLGRGSEACNCYIFYIQILYTDFIF